MERVLVNIGNQSYKCKVLKTPEEKRKGLMDVKFLPPDEGVLFEWDKEQEVKMWMKNTTIALDQISINEDDEVTKVYTGIPEDETLIAFPDTKYILEINANSGIREGDDFEIDDDEDLNKFVMKVVGSDGSSQFMLQGGERICSRISTKQLIKWAKKADTSQDDEQLFVRYCTRLGKRLFKEFYNQDHREAQYVKSPDN